MHNEKILDNAVTIDSAMAVILNMQIAFMSTLNMPLCT